ncbi:hypothetical protein B296_00018676, partial [Ensete ventricosum]
MRTHFSRNTSPSELQPLLGSHDHLLLSSLLLVLCRQLQHNTYNISRFLFFFERVRSPTLWSVMVPFVSSEANELWNGVSPDLGLCKIGSFYGHSRVAISRLRRLRRRGMALGPAGGAGGAADEPRLDALGVEPVAAGRQHADALALRQLRETDGALRGARYRGRPGGEHHGPRQLRRSRPRPGLVPAGRR